MEKTEPDCWEVKEEDPEYTHEVAATAWDSGPDLL
jgi:hypothetical protein